MKNLVIIGAMLVGIAAPALADEATPEMLNAALQAAIAQRDQAMNEGINLSVKLNLAQREINQMRKDAANKIGTEKDKSDNSNHNK